jgi:hypothetical protein
MSDITINNDESQNKNQKTTPVKGSQIEPELFNIFTLGGIFQIWLGRRDSNPRMLVPKTSALPLGDAPIMSECTIT